MRALRKGTHGVRDDRASGAGDGPPDVERCESSSADQAGNRQTQIRLLAGEREVPVPAQLIEVLAEHPRRVGSELVSLRARATASRTCSYRCK